MGGIFGGSQTISTSETPLAGMAIQSSSFGKPLALVYGRARVTVNMIGYYDFKAIPHTTSNSSSGGKGGGGVTSTSTTYTYQASMLFGLCEGPINSVNAFWVDKEYTPNANIFNKFTGSTIQTAWSYMASNHPTEALAYRRVAYVSAANYDLGSSAGLGNHSFDITGLLPYTAGTIDGANPREIILDLLTNAEHGAGFPPSAIGDWAQFSSYCIANNIFLSPVFDAQTESRAMIDDLMRITNAGIYFSEGVLKITPFSDAAATANSITYTPNITPAYDLGDDDYLDHEQPVRVLRTPNADAYNQVQIEFSDKANQFNTAIATAQDQASIEVYGLRPLEVIKASAITDATTARLIAQLILQRVLYTRNTYEFKIGWKYARLEPTDYITLTDARLGLDRVPVRILSIEEDEDGGLSISAEDAPTGVHSSPLYTQQQGQGYTVNYSTPPGNVAAPAFFEVPATQALSGLAIGAAVTGTISDWGGCEIWSSNDGTSYAYMGQVSGGARYGTVSNAITAAVGQVPRVTLSGNGGQMLSGSAADATVLSTLCLIDNEFCAHTTATLISANVYDLTLAVRGAHSTAAASHAAAAKFVRVDDAIAYSDSLALDMIGKTIYFKFLSFNKFGGGKQQLADVTAYSYVITGVMAKLPPPAISAPAALASQNSIFLNWTNPADATTDRVEVFRNTTNDVNTASIIGAVRGPVGFYADYLGASALTRYYWLRTVNKQGFPSAFTASVSATTGTVSAVPPAGSVAHSMMAADAIWAGNIKAGEVQAGHMAANSITAGAIAANAVTTGKIAAGAITAASGAIADLAVSTLKIQDNAVIVPVSTSATNQVIYSVSASTGAPRVIDFLSATIVNPGVPVLVLINFQGTSADGNLTGYLEITGAAGSRNVKLEIVRNGVVIATLADNTASAPNRVIFPNNISFTDAPGAGTFTYSVRGTVESGINVATFGYGYKFRAMTLLAVKK